MFQYHTWRLINSSCLNLGFANHSGMLLTALNGIWKQVSQNQVRHDMYNTICSFDANLARDPTNIVETN